MTDLAQAADATAAFLESYGPDTALARECPSLVDLMRCYARELREALPAGEARTSEIVHLVRFVVDGEQNTACCGRSTLDLPDDHLYTLDETNCTCGGRADLDARALALATLRPFLLVRHHDETGLSGTGVVAWGVQFPDGATVTRWCSSEVRQTCVWQSIDDVRHVHGHGGATEVVWL